jgi:hypothetical protein
MGVVYLKRSSVVVGEVYLKWEEYCSGRGLQYLKQQENCSGRGLHI